MKIRTYAVFLTAKIKINDKYVVFLKANIKVDIQIYHRLGAAPALGNKKETGLHGKQWLLNQRVPASRSSPTKERKRGRRPRRYFFIFLPFQSCDQRVARGDAIAASSFKTGSGCFFISMHIWVLHTSYEGFQIRKCARVVKKIPVSPGKEPPTKHDSNLHRVTGAECQFLCAEYMVAGEAAAAECDPE